MIRILPDTYGTECHCPGTEDDFREEEFSDDPTSMRMMVGRACTKNDDTVHRAEDTTHDSGVYPITYTKSMPVYLMPWVGHFVKR